MTRHRIATGPADEIENLDVALDHLLRSQQPAPDEHRRLRLRLGFHELLVNIRQHAYGERPGDIDVEFDVRPGQVTIGVTDRGQPFSGTVDAVLPAAPAIGGYGLPIIRAVFDQVHYERIGDSNHWTLTANGTENR